MIFRHLFFFSNSDATCAKIPSWMKSAMAATTGLERIINGKVAPEAIPWQVKIFISQNVVGYIKSLFY